MKKVLSIFGILSAVFISAQTSLTNTENYIYSKNCLNDDCTKASENVQYFDSYGRPYQSISIKSSPTGKDMVQHIPYDSYGRSVDSWFPVPMSTMGGAVQDSSAVKSNALTIYGDSRPFSHTILEKSPLSRPLSQISPGQEWQTHPVTLGYNANTGNEVKKYTVSTTWVEGRTESALSLLGNYPANTLAKNTATDEDGNVSVEFKNKQGQIILVKKGVGTANVTDTYYIYNEYGHLVYVLPPLAANVSVTPDVLEKLCYQYRYDGWNRLVEKKIPGKGWEYMVYDKADRLVMTQDANMRPSGNWLFTRYDKFSRPVYTGTAFVGASYTREQVQASVNYLIDQGQPSVEARNQTGFTNSGMSVYYGNTVYPTTVDKILTVNYYDTYPSYTFNPAFPADIQGAALLTEVPSADGRSTKGLPVMSLVKNIEDDNWTKNYTYYDTKGRAVGGYSINHLGGYTRTESQLDFTGVPLKSVTKHKRLDTDTEKVITENFEYDPQNRLLVHKHQVDSNPEEILAQNTYNELSQLKIKKVGGTVPTSALQTIDYQYNIRGWMTQINNPADLGADLFGYKINYNQVEGLETPNSDFLDLKVKPRYNGNIAEVSWKTLTQENEPLKRYGYSYDSLNRLSAGFYQKAGNETAKEYFEKLDYDLNGNIKRLQRSEGLLSGSTTAIAIDNLRYDYTGNKLTKITDEQQNPSGYPYLVTPNAIGYDNDNVEGNGNMISNLDKGISSIQYNYLNLPKQIIQNSTVTNITYRADGVKVKKLFGDLETDYLDGFQYKSTKPSESGTGGGWVIDDPNEVAVMKLKIIPTAEGYYDSSNNQYVYNFTDHLGNIRLSYTDTNKDGIIQPRQYHVQQCEGAWNPPFELPICIDYWKPGEIVEVNNYYPFGLLHNYTMTTQNAYQYKYNGKELQETGMYDYGARMYMPDIGRWGVQDPLSELYYSYSPYSYTINNPIRFIDPNGMWIDIKDGDMTYRYNEGKLYTQNGKTKKWDIEANVGNDSYAGKILSSLNSISGEDKNSFGNTFLGLFANDNINTTIQPSKGTNFEGQNGTYIDGSGIVTDFDQEVKPYTSMNGERTKQVQSPFYMTLFHEIGHSFFNQTSSRSELGKAWVDGNNNGLPKDISQGEIAASYIENLLRSEQGLPIRISYSPDANYSSTLVDAKSIKWQPTLRYNGPGNSQINTNSRIFTMPTSAQAIYNKIMNSKK